MCGAKLSRRHPSPSGRSRARQAARQRYLARMAWFYVRSHYGCSAVLDSCAHDCPWPRACLGRGAARLRSANTSARNDGRYAQITCDKSPARRFRRSAHIEQGRFDEGTRHYWTTATWGRTGETVAVCAAPEAPASTLTMRLFLSYADEDGEIAREIAARLSSANVSVYSPQDAASESGSMVLER